jgi:hypothetical protein
MYPHFKVPNLHTGMIFLLVFLEKFMHLESCQNHLNACEITSRRRAERYSITV